MYSHDRSTRSQLLALAACFRKNSAMARRFSAWVVGASFLRGMLSFISSTRSSRPQSFASCQGECRSFSISVSGTSLRAAFTIDRVCGTFRPRKQSPSPYSPLPVLKNRLRIALCFSSASACSSSRISSAVVIFRGCLITNVKPEWMDFLS